MKSSLLPLVLLSTVAVLGCSPAGRQASDSRVGSEFGSRPVEAGRAAPEEPETDEKAARDDEKTLVEQIRAGQPAEGANERFVDAILRIDELGGRLEFDGAGKLIGVDLAGDRMSAAADVVELLASLPHLESVKLAGGEITNTSAGCIGKMTDLVELALENTQIDNEGLAQLKGLVRLKSLSLRRSVKLNDQGLAHLEDFPALSHLSLVDNNFTEDGVARLGQLAKLQLLDLRGCPQVGDAALEHLKGLKNLTSLKLGGYGLTDAGMAALADLSSLRSLAIEDSMVTNAGLAHLEGLPIEEITVFRSMSVTDDGLAHFRTFTNLRGLCLRDVPVTGAGLVHIR
ncbi:MAG: hypothetical protein ABIK89_09525, partial [Planctomycetota bacterium]